MSPEVEPRESTPVVTPPRGRTARLVDRSSHPATVVRVGDVAVGEGCCIIAGPCSVESEAQILETAAAVKAAGADLLRGGAFKPRTSPYDFQGLGLEGLKLLRQAGRETGLPVVTEVVDPRDLTWVCEYADVLQIGARNMQNFSLLKEVGRCRKPVLLKRGMHSTLEEWLLCAEYVLAEGNGDVILCERGIRTFERYTRNTLDLSAVAAARERTHLPVLVDPTHGTGRPSLILPMSLAGIAAGAHGLLVEVHRRPEEALSDADQALTPAQFAELAARVRALVSYMEEQGSAEGGRP
ncbi:MAG: 3-deoxy-7-phosphoheptulonate synthase [Thermoanaerobaculaceae bacterium]|nr:3-deoxy-7-phosphoheptulonate synthase [Thermoanaerobaculaceae bacterium]MDI9622960.1 3-deoxy-7-phosphoheptulonate synthase [Acidobacteriota bacterium]HPW56906.1 3-deoxy-7-phosphoheptulonate synthase [Thermoanaerobaculaceae bacterium]